MNTTISPKHRVCFSQEPSGAAQERLLSRRGEPLFFAGWERALMIHFEVDAEALQRDVPYQLDLYEDRAFVSLVAFTLHKMRPRWGGALAARMLRPIATHAFLNVRTYVCHGGEPGIHFLAEWLSNRLAVKLGPATFSLPYHHGHIAYHHDWENGAVRGEVADVGSGNKLAYRAELSRPAAFRPCESGSFDEWLMERYTAFNSAGGRKRFFRVWHPPWLQHPAKLTLLDNSLLTQKWSWFHKAELLGRGHFSPGFENVWMGRPHSVLREEASKWL
ncbi:MAG TPA: DUF2071 domain-containing protein [Candidatus Acidoferrales bacterium]|nr:DUF2071 domain-containing protein [Candidatus Acidoferrales bacterium]